MPDSNSSKLTAWMNAAKVITDGITGISDTVILGQHDAAEVVARAKLRATGQACSILYVGANNPKPGADTLVLTSRFQVTLYDHPSTRASTARHGYELAEDIARSLHAANTQSLKAVCRDTTVTGIIYEVNGSADIFTITLDVHFHYTAYS